MVQPCCGSSLKQGTKFLAILQMALSVMGTISAGVFLLLIAAATLKSDGSDKLEGAVELEVYCVYDLIPEPFQVFIILILSILNLFLSIMLFIGAEQENLRVCFFWWRISFVLCLVDVVYLIVTVAFCTAITDVVINSAELLRSVYELWVVKAFMTELHTKQENACRVEVNMA